MYNVVGDDEEMDVGNLEPTVTTITKASYDLDVG